MLIGTKHNISIDGSYILYLNLNGAAAGAQMIVSVL